MNSENSLTSDDFVLDPYEVLEIERRSDDATIKRAYFQMVRQHPPEKDPEKFQQIRAAYEKLRTPDIRSITDLFLLQPPPPLPKRRRPKYDLDVHLEDLVVLAMEMIKTPMEQDFRELS
ncbi:J domain-containing protein [Chloroflexi bacterium TSY]|nr:J domain-containing protein [Chloroflexi bacterium TSY]